ncbi:MAG: DUF4956 domain-containing protein [Thiolinea sp.]
MMSFSALTSDFMIHLVINTVFLLLLLRVVYYRHGGSRDELFSFFLFGHGVYVVTGLMHNVDISMGFAFGLFAVFSMLRYRTEAISLRDMTYLFVVIVLSLLSAVGPLNVAELVLLNTIVCAIVAVAESGAFAPRTTTQTVVYDRVDNLQAGHRQALLDDLSERVGHEVCNIEIGEIDFVRDCVRIRVTFDPSTATQHARKQTQGEQGAKTPMIDKVLP